MCAAPGHITSPGHKPTFRGKPPDVLVRGESMPIYVSCSARYLWELIVSYAIEEPSASLPVIACGKFQALPGRRKCGSTHWRPLPACRSEGRPAATGLEALKGDRAGCTDPHQRPMADLLWSGPRDCPARLMSRLSTITQDRKTHATPIASRAEHPRRSSRRSGSSPPSWHARSTCRPTASPASSTARPV